MNTYRIDIFQNTVIIKTYKTADKAKAKSVYERNACKSNQYTQLSVNGKVFTTAKAEKLFGRRDVQGIKEAAGSW